MTINSLSEGFARITYAGGSVIHHQVLPINFSGVPEAGVEPNLTTKVGGTVGAIAGLGAYIDAVKAVFADDTIFGLCEIYAVDADDNERHFMYAFDLAEVGTGVGEIQLYKMLTMTWKTKVGGLLKLTFMEHRLANVSKTRSPYEALSDYALINTYMLSDDCIVIGRDNNYAFAPISASNRYSDALLPE